MCRVLVFPVKECQFLIVQELLGQLPGGGKTF